MKTILKQAFAAVLAATFSVTVPAGAAVNQSQVNAPITAHQRTAESLKSFKVGNTEVTAEQQKALYARIAAANPKAQPKVVADQVKKTLTAQAALKNEAVRLGLNKDKSVISALKAAEMNVLAEAAVAKYIKENPVKEEDVRKAYEKQKKAYGSMEYQLRNILVEDEGKAKAVIAEIKNKDDFARVAKLSSLDPATKNKGGLNDFLGFGLFSPEIQGVISKMKAGDTAKEPIKTVNGWQIVQIEAVRPAEKFPAYDAVKGNIFAALTAEKSTKYANGLAEKAVGKGK